MTAALRQHLASLHPLELKELEEPYRRFDIDHLAEDFGVTTDIVRAEIKRLKPKASADRFEWLEAITQRHDIGVRALRVAIAMFSFAGVNSYLWPSQASLARKAGYSDDAVVRRAITDLCRLGAIRKVKVGNLPKDLVQVVTGSVRQGGSGRSFRGKAYALVPPSEWSENALTGTPDTGTPCTGITTIVKPAPASPEDFTHDIGDSIDTPEYEETLTIRATDGRVTIGGTAP